MVRKLKPFKTYRQQLKILRNRGLKIGNGSRAIRILSSENYYSLINGYKDLFLETDKSGKPISPEKYKSGSTFEEIYQLYCFDRDLRNVLIEYLLKFEKSIKTKIAYRFSEKYGQPNTYLQMSNFSRDPEKLKDVLQLIAIISSIISDKAKYNNPIKHYLDNHDGVPLWVLVNYLTIGNIQNFYYCLDNSLREKIAKDFSIDYSKDYRLNIHITSDDLQNILKTATLFRNVCAHEERLYKYRIYSTPKSSKIAKKLNIPGKYLENGNLFCIVSFLKLVLSKRDHKTLISKIKRLFNQYEQNFSSVNFSKVLDTMGFPNNWTNYF